ncbi:MAG: NnrS family protein, partial [Geminicoccaceae bacterium]
QRLSPPILKQGFRPFFLGAALFAVIAVGLWLAMLANAASLPIAIDRLAWHQHEMLFGFTSAVIAGFLLTAVPNWTGRLSVRGTPLAALFGVWLAGRLAQASSAVIGAAFAAVIDASFLFLLMAMTGHEIVLSKNRRNLVVVGLLGLLAIANILFHLDQLAGFALDDAPLRMAMAAIAMLVALIGGRIVPSFTRNWLAKQDSQCQSMPAPFGRFDQVALLILAIALLGFVLAPDALPTHLLLTIAGVSLLVRLCRWRGFSTWREPLVWSLHAGYLCVAIGVALLGLTALIPDLDRLSATHALTAGGFGTMILAVMTRASLGHGGRALAADRLTTVIYLMVMLGALGRTVSNLASGSFLLIAAGLIWASAFLLFAIGYGKLLCSPRQPSK